MSRRGGPFDHPEKRTEHSAIMGRSRMDGLQIMGF